ncbi:DMT family transporter [Candidatus Woesebacteria bacterium]|nr:DMT family transporter [Candidatus Woesebacteria bacterium]
MHISKLSGIHLALITAFISGVSIFVNKFAVDAISPPLVFTAVKNAGVGILVVSVILMFGKLKHLKSLSRSDVFKLVAVGLIGGTLPFYLFFTGLSTIPAINAAMIHKSLVFWVSILAIIFLKERMTKTQLLAVLILFSSNYVIPGFKGFSYSVGELMILGATFLWSIETIIAKKVLSHVDPDIVTGFRMGLGSLILMILAFIQAPASLASLAMITPIQLFWLGLTMLTLFGYVSTWYRALKLAPAITVTAVLVSSTLVTNILSAVFVTRTWSGALTIQGAVIVLGLGLLLFANKTMQKSVQLNAVRT